MDISRRASLLLILLLSALLSLSCFGKKSPVTGPDETEETGGTDNTGGDGDSDGTDDTGGGVEPQFAGFDFSLSEGDYWEFYWSYKSSDYVQGSGGSTSTDGGNFRITLGAPVLIGDIEAFSLEMSGDTGDSEFDYTPRWKYLALSGSQFLGSLDGMHLETVFDAQNGVWQGGGLFMDIAPGTESTAGRGSIDNEFIQTDAIRTGRSANQDFCETIAGQTICANDEAYTFHEYEYYKEGIGPVGYYSYVGYAFSGGNFYTSYTDERHLGLVACSFAGQTGVVPTEPPWREKAAMPTARLGLACAAVNGRIYVMGGDFQGAALNTVEIYDPAADSWATGTSMPAALLNHTCTAYGSDIYVLGGNTARYGASVNTLWKYDTVMDTWTRLADAPRVMADHSCVETGGYLWVIVGGSKDVYAYEIATDTWWLGTSPPWSVYEEHAACGDGASIFVTGGLYQDWTTWKYVRTNLSYDLTQDYGSPDAWRQATSMADARARHTAVALDGIVYVLGGSDANDAIQSVEAYDPAADTWTGKFPMPEPRQDHASAVVNGRIYVIGGRGSYDPVATVFEYNPANDR